MSTLQPPRRAPTEPDTAALRVLATALRMPMPEGFEWDMAYWEDCAWGLARHIGLVNTVTPRTPVDGRNALGLTRTQSQRLFCPGIKDLLQDGYVRIFPLGISPAVQAARIEKFVRTIERAKAKEEAHAL